jgi:hypothetical protein
MSARLATQVELSAGRTGKESQVLDVSEARVFRCVLDGSITILSPSPPLFIPIPLNSYAKLKYLIRNVKGTVHVFNEQ